MHYMKWIYPRRLRNQMILMAILMVIVPTLTIGYIVETEGRSAVLSEKEKKLSAVVNLLNQALGDRYDLYIDLPREERIRALNAEPRQPGGCKLKTAPVRPVVAARPAEYVCSEDLFY